MKDTSYPIVWHAEGDYAPGNVSIYWSEDGGTNWTLIASGEDNDGAYLWLVPDNETGYALVRVSVTDVYGRNASDTSDAGFAIDPPPTYVGGQPGDGGTDTGGEQTGDGGSALGKGTVSDSLPVQVTLMYLISIEILMIGLILLNRRKKEGVI